MHNSSTKTKQMLDNITIVLMAPKYPENIGAAARCALNMGISRLAVVSVTAPDREKMLKMATHKAAHLIDNLNCFTNLAEALAPFSHVVGTTARQGRKRRIENSWKRTKLPCCSALKTRVLPTRTSNTARQR
jgi:tRNA/rRNA methyltransferase